MKPQVLKSKGLETRGGIEPPNKGLADLSLITLKHFFSISYKNTTCLSAGISRDNFPRTLLPHEEGPAYSAERNRKSCPPHSRNVAGAIGSTRRAGGKRPGH